MKYALNDLAIEQQRVVRWLASGPGKLFLRVEQSLLDKHLPRLFGVHLLQSSVLGSTDMCTASPVNHRFFAVTVDQKAGQRTTISELEQLPLENDSVDVIVLQHVLEFSDDPHAVLREMYRVLRPEGRIVVLVFNPWSMLGLQQRLLRRFRANAWRCHSIGGHRVTDWLQVLGFDVNSLDYCWYSPALSSDRLRNSMLKLEAPLHRVLRPLGGASIVVATKKSATLIPIRKRWRELRPGLAVPAMKPTTQAAMTRKDKLQ
ncbi:MAG: class I SAM-dependent methyltransferase [Pseudomonadales bacterium]